MSREKFVSGFFYWGAVGLTLYLCIRYLLPACLPILIGGAIAVMLRPIAAGLCEKTKIPYKITAVLTILLAFLLVGGLLWWLGSLLLYQFSGFFGSLQSLYSDTVAPMLAELETGLAGLLGSLSPESTEQLGGMGEVLGESIQGLLGKLSSWVMSTAGNLAAQLPGWLLSLSFAVLATVFMLLDYRIIVNFLKRQLPSRWYASVKDIIGFLSSTGKNIIRAYFFIMLITFVEVSLGLWLLGVEYYLVMGLLVAVLDILPIIGSGAVLLPWGLYLVVGGNLTLGGGILLLWGVITVVRTVIEPKILGDRIGLHPLVTLIAMVLGVQFGGMGGLIFAPVLATLFIYLNRQGYVKIIKFD